MKNVMSVRVSSEGRRRLRELARRERKEVSTVARELMDYGWVFLMLRDYRAGRVSLGTLAQKLDVPLSEAIDLLAELGVRSPLEYDDYLKGLSAAMAFVKTAKA
jgi:predicted transcriptional regulator